MKFITVTNIKSLKINGWKFHFVDIQKPNDKANVSVMKLFKSVKTASMVKMQTDINGNDFNYTLVKLFKKRYSIL